MSAHSTHSFIYYNLIFVVVLPGISKIGNILRTHFKTGPKFSCFGLYKSLEPFYLSIT